MPTPIKLVQTERVVIISPSDVAEERAILFEVIDELNATVAHAYQVHLQRWAWEADARPGFHKQGPQGMIDDLIDPTTVDIVVGIFWHRIGTPIPALGGKTGTVHEFKMFLDLWKKTGLPQILIYFKQEPYLPRDRADLKQWDGVLKFRQGFPETGFSWEFRTAAEFEKLARVHLAKVLVDRHGRSFAKGVAIIDSRDDLIRVLLETIAKAGRSLWTTGSRSHDEAYLEAIERKLRDDPEVSYHRILFGMPHYQSLKDHLVRAEQIGGRRGGGGRVLVSMFERSDRQAEVSICAGESQAVITLPSFNKFGTFDSAVLFTDPFRLGALHDFVSDLEGRATPLAPCDLRALDELNAAGSE